MGDAVHQLAVLGRDVDKFRHRGPELEAGGILEQIRDICVSRPLSHQGQREGGVKEMLGGKWKRKILAKVDELQVRRKQAGQLGRISHSAEIVIEEGGAPEESQGLFHDDLPHGQGV